LNLQSSSLKSKNVLVVGSKPYSSYPDLDYAAIVSANGAARLLSCFNSPIKVAIVSSAAAQSEFIRNAVALSSPSEIVLRCHGKADFQTIKHSFPTYALYKGKHMAQLEFNTFGTSVYRCYLKTFLFRSGPKAFMSRMIGHISGNYRAFACSTGLWAVAYALNLFPDHNIFVTGIGLKPGGHFHGCQTGDFQSLTADKDYILAKRLATYKLLSPDLDFCAASKSNLVTNGLKAFPGDVC
jgi:hypothetical protein